MQSREILMMKKPFAIYFPQFYPVPTNDAAWGKGFTDWMLVANANLRSTWSRRAPEIGFYDGASEAVHRSQIQTATDYGLAGFAVYHYWFYTHQELGAFERTLTTTDASPNANWFLIWASEPWTRRWLGDPSAIVSLTPEPNSTEVGAHCDYLCTCFSAPGYFRLNGNPVFIWYNLGHFRDPERVVSDYRETLFNRGYEVALGQFIKNPFEAQYASLMDLNYLFEPRLFFGTKRKGRNSTSKRAMSKITDWFGEGVSHRMLQIADRAQQKGERFPSSVFIDYISSTERKRILESIKSPVQEVISPGWDNTPRYGTRYTAIESLRAEQFRALLEDALQNSAAPPLINAWNEWSEGAAIEPCAYLGRRYLDVISQVVHRIS